MVKLIMKGLFLVGAVLTVAATLAIFTACVYISMTVWS